MPFLGFSQDASYGVGDWQVHVPYDNVKHVAVAGNRVYAASASGLFYYDKEDNSLNKLSKIEGLNDFSISALGYDKVSKTLVIAYSSGNLDLIQDNTIINISDIYRKFIIGSKKINHVHFSGKYAYLSCDFGLVVLDMEKQEVKESYQNIGQDGEQLKVLSTTTISDSLFLVSDEGVLGASRDAQYNLMDFNNWERYPAAEFQNQEMNFVASNNDTVYVASDTNIFYKDGAHWTLLPKETAYEALTITSLWGGGNYIVAGLYADGYLKISGTNKVEFTKIGGLRPQALVFDDQGYYWSAHPWAGLGTNYGGGNWLKPNGPLSTRSHSFYFHDGTLFTLAGGHDIGYVPFYSSNGYYTYSNFEWKNYPNHVNKFEAGDLVDVVYNPSRGKYYFASYGSGIRGLDSQGNIEVINDTTAGSVLANAGSDTWRHVRVTDLTMDRYGNMWGTGHNTNGKNSLYKMLPDGSWESFGFSDSRTQFLVQVEIDQYDTKWLRIGGSNATSGVYAFNDRAGEEKYLLSQLPNSKVYDVAIDKDGAVWFATGAGVAVYYNPAQIFDNQSPTKPIYEGFALLKDEIVYDIAIDGGNRKWFATSSGIWLFNEDVTEQLLHFNAANSPLPTDKVTKIGINEETGEIFLATEQGILSYWGNATEVTTAPTEENVKVFPNPVRPNFDGQVGVTGLPENAVVKITDISGKLVYETDAEGGMISWNVQDINGRKVKGGVYLIYAVTPDGVEGLVGKVTVVD